MSEQERIQAAWSRVQARRIYSEEQSVRLVAESLGVSEEEVREAINVMAD